MEPPPGQHNSVFWGPQGLRVGWRLLLAATVWLALLAAMQVGLVLIPPVRAWLVTQSLATVTPAFLLFGEGPSVIAMLLAMALMAKIEGRRFADYYFPTDEILGKRFWQGVPFGFAAASLMMGLIAALHGFSLGSLGLNAAQAVEYGGLYFFAFLLVGLFEEAAFRGYLQATLSEATGFWPAALALSALFGLTHLANPGETKYGALMVAAFGLLSAFTLQRTGNLWFAIGMHTAWDWGETFFYSVPDSGILAYGHLYNSAFHGPTWLTGGAVGPEGSIVSFVTLGLCAVAIHFLFPRRAIEE